MEFKRLEALVAIHREGSVSAAAESLGVGQPTISHHLRKLEEETGAVLSQRVGRGLRLTSDGVRLAQRGAEILALMRRADEELDAATSLAGGRVRLAAFPSAMSTLVPQLLTRLNQMAPQLILDLVEAEPPAALAALRSGEVDLAITFAYAGQSYGTDIEAEHLGWDPLYLLTPTAKGAPKHLKDFAHEPWIAGCERCRTGLVALCEDAGFAPDIRFESDDSIAVQALVSAGFGITVLPELVLRGYQSDGVDAVELPGAGRQLHIATYGRPPRPAAVEEAAQSLLEVWNANY